MTNKFITDIKKTVISFRNNFPYNQGDITTHQILDTIEKASKITIKIDNILGFLTQKNIDDTTESIKHLSHIGRSIGSDPNFATSFSDLNSILKQTKLIVSSVDPQDVDLLIKNATKITHKLNRHLQMAHINEIITKTNKILKTIDEHKLKKTLSHINVISEKLATVDMNVVNNILNKISLVSNQLIEHNTVSIYENIGKYVKDILEHMKQMGGIKIDL